mmetsp:Transcript_33972/g.74820  ORF Transcript_33972/g.74820 Transcript_33972/m.74820 type:complete len:202 (-) Transcript_33972:399-1004(-)
MEPLGISSLPSIAAAPALRMASSLLTAAGFAAAAISTAFLSLSFFQLFHSGGLSVINCKMVVISTSAASAGSFSSGTSNFTSAMAYISARSSCRLCSFCRGSVSANRGLLLIWLSSACSLLSTSSGDTSRYTTIPCRSRPQFSLFITIPPPVAVTTRVYCAICMSIWYSSSRNSFSFPALKKSAMGISTMNSAISSVSRKR